MRLRVNRPGSLDTLAPHTEGREEMRWFWPEVRVHQCGADCRELRLQPVHCGRVAFALVRRGGTQWNGTSRRRPEPSV